MGDGSYRWVGRPEDIFSGKLPEDKLRLVLGWPRCHDVSYKFMILQGTI